MTKTEALERLALLQRTLERLPDKEDFWKWLHIWVETPKLNAPEIMFTAADEFQCAAEYFGQAPALAEHDDRYGALEFYVDGIRMFNLVRKQEGNENDGQ